MTSREKVITRHSICGTLCLPPDLACVYCKPSIQKAVEKNSKTIKVIKKCVKPFSIKWQQHCEVSVVYLYNEIHEYLNWTNIVEDKHSNNVLNEGDIRDNDDYFSITNDGTQSEKSNTSNNNFHNPPTSTSRP